jgi:hypothetical protein
MKDQEEKKFRSSGKPSDPNLEDTTGAGKTFPDQEMNKPDQEQQGRIQNPNETTVSEDTQEKIQKNEPGSLERKGAENNAQNQHRKNLLDHLDKPNHGDA